MRQSLDSRHQKLSTLGARAAVLSLLVAVVAGVSAVLGQSYYSSVLSAVAAFLATIAAALTSRRLEETLFALAFGASTFACWPVGVVGAQVVLTPLGYDFGRHPDTSVWLASLSLWAIAAAIATWQLWRPAPTFTREDSPLAPREWRNVLAFLALAYLLYSVSSAIAGLSTARWTVGNRYDPGSAIYFVNALGGLRYPFFFFLGAGLSRDSRRYSLIATAVLTGAILLAGASGGREFGLFAGAAFLLGAAYSELRTRQLLVYSSFGIPLAAAFIIAVGLARGADSFESLSTTDRVRGIVGTASPERQDSGDIQEHPGYVLFSRVAMPQAQFVIDNTLDSGNRVGFANFDRIPSFFVPKFIYPDKKDGDDTWDRLIEGHGFVYSQFSSPPLSVLADSYERFGTTGVVCFAYGLSVLLLLANFAILQIRDPVLRFSLFSSMSSQALLVAQKSVLGTVSIFTWTMLRDAIIFAALLQIARWLGVYATTRPARFSTSPISTT